MQKIKLGIVGFGFMGHCDADMMKTFQNIDLVAVADTNPQQLEEHRKGSRHMQILMKCWNMQI